MKFLITLSKSSETGYAVKPLPTTVNKPVLINGVQQKETTTIPILDRDGLPVIRDGVALVNTITRNIFETIPAPTPIVVGNAWVIEASSIDQLTKVYIDAAIAVQQPPTYKIERRNEYPSIGDQLDALWHAMDEGIIPHVEPMYSAIKSVKDTHPKP